MRYFKCLATEAIYSVDANNAVQRWSKRIPWWHKTSMFKDKDDLLGENEELDDFLIEIESPGF